MTLRTRLDPSRRPSSPTASKTETALKYRIKTLDLVLLALLVSGATYIGYRVKTELHYTWHWSVIGTYLLRYDQKTGHWVPNLLLQGLFTTVRLSVWATVLATILGTLGGFFRVSSSLFKRMVGRTFVELVRNTPPLVLVFVFYYFVSDQIMPALGVNRWIHSTSPSIQSLASFLFATPATFSAFLSATVTIAIFEAAYITEIVRAGIQSIDKGQFEASDALGLSWWQKMRYVILPQVIQRILPPLAGQFISTIKDSAIVSVISIQELTFQGMEIMSSTYLTFECWITIALLYFVLTMSLSMMVNRLEKYVRRTIL